jgi:hypothetical protein
MTIARLDGIAECYAAISNIVRTEGAGLSAPVYAALAAFQPSPVVRIVNCAEALYAEAKALAAGAPRDALASCAAQLVMTCVENQWHELGQSARGLQITMACRRMTGDTSVSQAEADDPAPLADYVTPPT